MQSLSRNALQKLSAMLRGTAIRQLARALHLALPKAEIFLVGGYVRDLILGRDTKDIDLVVRGVPIVKLEAFLKTAGKVNLVGKRFGVFKFIPKNKHIPAIDIALPRTEHSFGTGGYRDVTVQADSRLPIHDDLGRRDFTMNAMAWNILNEHLVDPWHGLDDIRKKTVRAVGLPGTRFREDYSRMLRALRFACELNFKIEPKTWKAIKTSIKHLNDRRHDEFVVSREVIAKELLKSFIALPTRALELYDSSGAIKMLMPELLAMKGCPQPKNYHSEGDVWTHTKLALSVLESPAFNREFDAPANAEMVMAVLLHDIAKPKTITYPKRRGERIRFDGHDTLGAKMAKQIAERLRLASYKSHEVKPPEGGLTSIDVDAKRLAGLIKAHLLLISGAPETMRATTIERYYLRDVVAGKELLALQFADGSAARSPSGRSSLIEYRALKKRIAELTNKKTHELPPPILNGDVVMKTLGIKAGPEVGRILHELREAQLTGKVKTKREAHIYVGNNYRNI